MNSKSITKSGLLQWINNELDTDYIKIEYLGDCVGYIQILHMYFPKKVNLSLVKCKLKSSDK